MKKLIVLKLFVAAVCLAFTTDVVAQKNKLIEGKKYNVQFYEMKGTVRGKTLPTIIVIKGGKISCDLMEEKIQLPASAYKVVNDSTYTEDDAEMHFFGLESEFSEDKSDYKWVVTINNSDIEGTVVQSRNGVEKKKFEFSGSEKFKK